jgi:macrolide transport system ATP-binding/permease protein
MNIMLVSVSERTREIGIRMAIGARKRDILLQFNTESIVVCAIGGVLGIIFGVLFSFILQFFGTNIYLSTFPAILAFMCSCIIGVVFGYLPSKKAADLDPVIALSFE